MAWGGDNTSLKREALATKYIYNKYTDETLVCEQAGRIRVVKGRLTPTTTYNAYK